MSEQTHHRAIVVGTGFAGLGAAVRLREAGITDFVLLDRANDVGGTWRDNTYPGAACDVPSHLYSFSFDLNPDWSRSFSRQPEIQDYLRRVTDRHGLRPHLRLGHELLDATWEHDARRWRVRTPHGELTCDVLISGTGALSDPSIPAIPGLDTFTGTVFHSAQWDHSYDLRGKRVAVVGTGASAIQFVPRIQPQVASLTLFQRTPPWIIPRLDRDYLGVERAAFRRVPGLQRLLRSAIWTARESLVLGLAKDQRLLRGVQALASAHLRRSVSDPELRRKLTPDYRIGCKRMLISNDYLPALAEPNVDVVASGVAEVGPNWVRGADGTVTEVDAIIFGTGFLVTAPPVASRIRGRAGQLLSEAWSDIAQAHRGTTIAGFPNLFMLVGPNTGLGHTSMVQMIESQLAYVIDGLRHLERSGSAAVEVRPEAQARYNAELQEAMRGTVWTAGGCASWYLDSKGRNSTLWPSFTWRFRQETRHFRSDEYVAYPAEVPAKSA